MKKLFLFLLVLMCYSLRAQDMHFTQLSQTQLYLNPAFVGIMNNPRVLVQLRNQYPQISSQINGGFNTYMISYDQFIKEINSGAGLRVMMDQLGKNAFSRYYINGTYAYQVKLNRFHALRFGLNLKMVIQQLDVASLQFFDQIDPINGFQNFIPTQETIDENYSSSYFNMDAGALYFRNKMYVGFGLRNLLPKKYLYDDKSKAFEDVAWSAQLGGVGVLNEDKRMAVFGFVNYDRQYGYNELVANGLFQYQMVNLGLGFRTGFEDLESISLLLGLNFNSFRVSYSYDIQSNALKSYSGGAHELGIRILIGGEDNSLSPNYMKHILFCPDFMKN